VGLQAGGFPINETKNHCRELGNTYNSLEESFLIKIYFFRNLSRFLISFRKIESNHILLLLLIVITSLFGINKGLG
jgi:hypothetical protein